MLKNQKCSYCQYWLEDKAANDFFGLCIYNPPVALVIEERVESYFPETHGEQVCGKFLRDPDLV